MAPRRAPSPRVPAPKTSRFVGVTRYQAGGKYAAFVKVNGKRIHLGMWRGERDAAVARDRAVLYFGLDAKHNLPTISARLGPASPDDLRRLSRLDAKKNENSSSYIGVIWHARRARWRVNVCTGQGKSLHVALFDDEKDAAAAYDRIVLHMFGKDAVVNFPEKSLPASLKEVRREAWRLSKLRKTSRYRGVSWNVFNSYWISQIGSDYKRYHLDNFASEEDAALAYDRAAKRLFGIHAMLNFPATSETDDHSVEKPAIVKRVRRLPMAAEAQPSHVSGARSRSTRKNPRPRKRVKRG